MTTTKKTHEAQHPTATTSPGYVAVAAPPASTNPPPVPQIPAATVVSVTSTTSDATTTSSSTQPSSTPVATPDAASPLPTDATPVVPPTFTPPIFRDFGGYRASSRQVSAALSSAANLQSFVNYAGSVGSAAPNATVLANMLILAFGWRQVRNASKSWAAYARAQDALAWKQALVLLDQLRPLFLSAVTVNPQLATQYAGLTAMFAARSTTAKHAAVTRKKKAKAKAAAAPAAPANASGAAPPTSAAPVPPAPTKTVTVNT